MSLTTPSLLFSIIACCLALPAAASRPGDPAPPGSSVAGVVLDTSGAIVTGAAVTLRVAGGHAAETVTDDAGQFAFAQVPAGPARLLVSIDGFSTATVDLSAAASRAALRIVMEPLPVSEQVTVRAESTVHPTVSATRTNTPLRDLPQAASIVTRQTIAEQGMQSLADLVRYVPGVGMAQGEGNRDAAIFRGNNSTADFFVDGVRDDVQYYRDLYNVERVEVLKGANAMTFGRGGAGGVLNRVTREASWSAVREFTLQAGAFDNRRVTMDVGQAIAPSLAARITAVYEHSGSYRDGVGLERYGVNPTVAATLGTRTVLTLGYERFHDSRTADRGVPSDRGRPVEGDPSVFFGDPNQSRSRATVDAVSATLQHNLAGDFVVRNHTRFADYDKFYQNVYPTGVTADGATVTLSAYNNATTRKNLFNQTDVTGSLQAAGMKHSLLFGAELGRQETTNFRQTGYFGSGATTTSRVPIEVPTASIPTAYRQSATDADNAGVARVAAVYVQDQVEPARHVRLVAGLRYETFNVDFHNHRTGAGFASVDHLASPRLGVVVKPVDALSFYASYSLAYVPRAGEQLSSLTLSNQALDPEQFRNYEAGAKWDVRPALFLTTAIYRLDRRNVAVPDPANPAVSNLVAGQRTRGVEVEANGRVTRWWHLVAGYAYQQGEITASLSATAPAGARLAQVPPHSLSFWNRWELTRRVGAGLGVIRRADMFAATDNTVVVPAFTRADAAIYVALHRRLRAQANVENLFDRRYFASANGNDNIAPASPRAARVVFTTSF
jgi:catecholate siderophore receptor